MADQMKKNSQEVISKVLCEPSLQREILIVPNVGENNKDRLPTPEITKFSDFPHKKFPNDALFVDFGKCIIHLLPVLRFPVFPVKRNELVKGKMCFNHGFKIIKISSQQITQARNSVKNQPGQ